MPDSEAELPSAGADPRTAMATAIARSEPLPEASSPIIERSNRASIGTRIAQPLLRGTVGFGLATLARIGGYDQLEQMLWLGRLIDLPAAVLVPPNGTKRRRVQLEKFRAEWLWHDDLADPSQRQDSALLYFHGGGYISGGLNTHRRLVAKIGRASRMPAFNVDYRQLPDAHFTETLDDAVESYKYLLAQGFQPERIIVSGDSAGGGLAFRLALATRERGLPMPGGISAIAPWADFDSTTRNAHPNRHRDSYLPTRILETIVRQGFAIDGELDPTWSSVNHDFTDLPPVLIQVGSTECLLPDAEILTRRCARANVPIQLQIWDRAPHVHHIGSDLLSDARAAIRDLGQFHRQVIAGQIPSANGRISVCDRRNTGS
ncbi:alpha/beta hydrolase [Nocardia sp. NBC_01009]|uniref:alpha/beta hydrolase n=1 Tax=Nocardia sp. NBC_01009 TaxID=2975996 RepID=UPI0038658BBD|nr:alpha/beta hydrolase [Nocardia sp. NBC_01009]